MTDHEKREKFLKQPYSEELADKIENLARKLCIWTNHKDIVECQDCPEFDKCNIYAYSEKICEIENIKKAAKKEMYNTVLKIAKECNAGSVTDMDRFEYLFIQHYHGLLD